MPRRSRIIVPGIPLHIIQRGNNRQPCFFAEEDYLFYLDWLEEYSKATGCLVHAYVLMTNHVHLLITPKKSDSAGRLMKSLGQRYVQYVSVPIEPKNVAALLGKGGFVHVLFSSSRV